MRSYVPDHIAIIMDGNGRWGKTRGLTRSEGHYAGVKAMERVIDAGIELGVKVLTLYAFSSENWSRPQDEVNYLMQLPVKYFKQKLPEFKRRNCQIRISGNIAVLPKGTKQRLSKLLLKRALIMALLLTSHLTMVAEQTLFRLSAESGRKLKTTNSASMILMKTLFIHFYIQAICQIRT
ncbi:Ditrans,polycis-undecaprenyl-diphosphate synthase ((2E,6E)-farnesyl-diphosphate specific) [Lentibacillus sp. JNUCC-1]|nr:Ditrans,polycis-undecaprenyl-diphosphate synthase ((2E,6E)-farnesyl-diphosphate specific) [Lentibacillus sp. JNUCC-1]